MAKVLVTMKNGAYWLPVYVLESDSCSNLFGLPWLRATSSNLVNECLKVGKIESTPKDVADITEKFASVFNQSLLETMSINPVTIRCESQYKPVYRKARPLPLALQTKVKNELDRMVETRINTIQQYNASVY